MLRLRKAYFKRKKEFEGRRIWLFFDKLYKAGDNGEYAFRHAMKRNDGIECYYVINADSGTTYNTVFAVASSPDAAATVNSI